MSNDISLVISAFEELSSKKFDKGLYSHRLIAQKLAYIMKTLGYSINSSFSWYLRGPYSHELALEMFNSENEEPVNTNLTEIREFIQGDINDPKKMELIGSLLYIIREGGKNLQNEDDLIFTLCSLKPQFNKEEVKSAINRIKSQPISL